MMDGLMVRYKGKMINALQFRAFIYDAEGNKKLLDSWTDFERHMQTGVWFADKKDIPVKDDEVVEEKPKRVRPKPQAKVEAQSAPKVPQDDLGYEVKPGQDDFLSDARE